MWALRLIICPVEKVNMPRLKHISKMLLMKVLGHAYVGFQSSSSKEVLTEQHVDIAGVPGTGKTATVRSVVRTLQARAESDVGFQLYWRNGVHVLLLQEINAFRFLEINGMKLTEPQQAFGHLWEFISGQKSSPKAALEHLEQWFKTPSPGRETWQVALEHRGQTRADS